MQDHAIQSNIHAPLAFPLYTLPVLKGIDKEKGHKEEVFLNMGNCTLNFILVLLM